VIETVLCIGITILTSFR